VRRVSRAGATPTYHTMATQISYTSLVYSLSKNDLQEKTWDIASRYNSSPFNDYVENFWHSSNFEQTKGKSRGIFGRRGSQTKNSSNSNPSEEEDIVWGWQVDALKKPILISSQDTHSFTLTDCQDAFRQILFYCGDVQSTRSTTDHAAMLVGMIASISDENYTDEVYNQVIKQTHNSNNESGTICAWQLLLILLASAPPSSTLIPPFGSYLAQNIRNSESLIADYSAHLLYFLPKMEERVGPRLTSPSNTELQAILRLRSISIKVEFVDGRFIAAPTNSWTTVHDVVDWICEYLGIQDSRQFSLFLKRTQTKKEKVSLIIYLFVCLGGSRFN